MINLSHITTLSACKWADEPSAFPIVYDFYFYRKALYRKPYICINSQILIVFEFERNFEGNFKYLSRLTFQNRDKNMFIKIKELNQGEICW